MNYQKIIKLQKEHPEIWHMQELIDSGACWKMEGSVGREAMRMLESGACMLPTVPRYNAYNNRIPTRNEVKPNSTGTLTNSQNFWEKVENGEIDLYECEE